MEKKPAKHRTTQTWDNLQHGKNCFSCFSILYSLTPKDNSVNVSTFNSPSFLQKYPVLILTLPNCFQNFKYARNPYCFLPKVPSLLLLVFRNSGIVQKKKSNFQLKNQKLKGNTKQDSITK